MELLALRDKPEKLFVGQVLKNKQEKTRENSMFEGKNIHSSPVDGKLLCSYSEKVCMQRRLNGFAFCIRHILEDKGAPFKQCQFFAKYNKSRCINPVPILEKRNYCNSHMQVLGIIPKKLKKKKEGDKCSTSGLAKETKAKDDKNNSIFEVRDKTNNKCNHSNKNIYSHSQNLHGANKKTISHNKAGKQNFETIMPPLRWNPYNHMWKKLFHKGKEKHSTARNICYSSVENLKTLKNKCEEESKDLFKSYTFDKAEDALDHEEISWQTDSTSDFLLLLDDFSEDEIRSRLLHQTAQLKQSIKTRLEDKKLTYTFLNALVNATKTNPAATANAINTNTGHKNFRNRKVITPKTKCAANFIPNLKCSKTALPYSRHCYKHVGYDKDQVLFGKCTARFAAGQQCSVPVVDLVNERPLCDEHSRKMMISANREAATGPPKRSKKLEKVEKCRAKPVLPRRNLKAQLQKKFAIPNKPKRKPNSHIVCAAAIGNTAQEKTEILQSTESEDNDEWQMNKNKDDSEYDDDDDDIIITPRGYETINANGTSELSFDMDSASLSSPSISEDEGRYPLVNMGRSHQDSFNFDEDEDMLRNSSFNMGVIPDPRDVTSPTLMQLSTESIPSTLSLGALCSPSKLPMEKSLFESALQIKQEPPSPGLRRSINLNFDLNVTSSRGDMLAGGPPRLIGNMKSEGQFTSRTSLLNSDRYCTTLTTNASANNHVIPSNINSVSTNNTSWSKFTLSTRNEGPNTTAGFIRVGPQNSVYSPPFTSPSPRSKTSIFKFENSSKAIENDLVALPRNPPPPYSAVVQDKAIERRYEAEPPLQKVNPDIFLSTMFTATPTSTGS